MSDYTGVDVTNCGLGGGSDTHFELRVGSIFIIWFGGTAGALFPVLARRTRWLRVPKSVFEFAKYFGSGVIIATAFIHLLDPAVDALGSDCLADAWGDYPYALALCLLGIFVIFVAELIAFRWGTAKLAQLGITHDPHGHNAGVLVGLTLAVDENFIVLFIVLIFHQTFEGLGVGSRLAFMDLPAKYSYVPAFAAVLYGVTMPIGIAAGLGVKTTYNPESTTASIVSGTMDSLSAGILIYTGVVELLAHEFLFDKEMMQTSNRKLAYALGSMLLGCGIMAVLGRWA
ncbi:hypothetical protein ONZ45_g12915 [Pleurotus djamor]|nr:hypothetical protein ONZ45_g12915 [Pleurotus djamor]